MSAIQQPRSPLIDHGLRWLTNIALLLGLTLGLSMVGRLLIGADQEIGYSAGLVVYVWFITTYLFLPGAVLYLLLLELVPIRWSLRARRLTALLLSPLIVVFFWINLVSASGSPGLRVLILLAGAATYAGVVRLRSSQRA